MAIEVKHTTQAVGTDAGNGEIAKTQWNEAHTINMATGNLLGRSTAGAGAAEEIAIGSGLSLSAGTLSASGGGGGASAITISNKTAAYTVVAGDLGTIINCTSGTFSVSLTDAATLGAGFNVTIWNTSATATDAITIDPSGAETIDGKTTLILRRGEGMQIVCDGTNWQTGDKKTMRGYAENIPATYAPIASGNISIALGGRATASGSLRSIAIGDLSIASADESFAVQNNAVASGAGSLAIGRTTAASSSYSAALGNNSAGSGSKAVTGSGAMALGGSYASGADSFAAAIGANTSTYGAKGGNSVAFGYLANASGSSTLAISTGNGATASGTGAIAIGGRNYGLTASGAGSCAIGDNVTATAEYAFAFGHRSTSVIYGKMAYASGYFAAVGDGQTGTVVLRRATADATASVLTSSGAAGATTNQVIPPNNSAYAFTGIVVAKQSGSTNAASWKVEGMIVRGANAASTTLVFSTVTPISNIPLWTLALSADTTNGGLAVTFTGAAATNIRTVATIQTSEVTYT